jgi:hypothetical protein
LALRKTAKITDDPMDYPAENLLLTAIQAAAAIVAAVAALAMWRATANLVKATRELTLARKGAVVRNQGDSFI